MNKQINVGIVGFGKMGVLHAGILNALPDCNVKAICETEPLVRKIASKALPPVRFYDSPFDMATQESLDAVYVTTPIPSHLSVVTELARSGKRLGVFVEKPLAGSTQEARQIVEVTSKFATADMIGFQKRFLPQFLRAKELLDEGALGEVTSFHGYSYLASVFSKGRGWRFKRGEGGALLDLGPHLIDIVIWYFGMPSSIMARESSTYSELVEDSAHIEFGFKEGISGSVDVSWSKEGYRLPETCLEISGSNGILKVSDDILELNITKGIVGLAQGGRSVLRRPELLRGVDFLLGDPEYCLEDEQFLLALRNESPAAPSLEGGVGVNKVIELAHAAAAKGDSE